MKVLDIGCDGKKTPGAVGMDFYAYPDVEVVHDMTKFPWPFPEGAFDYAVAHQVLEHIPHRDDETAGRDLLFSIFDEVYRILRPGGVFEFDVPHVRSRMAVMDITHRRFFNEDTFSHLWLPERDSGYPRKIWKLVSQKTTHVLGPRGLNNWHLRKVFPRAEKALQALSLGYPNVICVKIMKPGAP